MGYKQDFKVNILRLTSAVAQKGFGTILMVTHEKEHELTTYVDAATLAGDFESVGDEYALTIKMGNNLFAQGVDKIMVVGKSTELPSELVSTLNATTVINDEFFGVVSTDNSDEAVAAVSEWVDAQQKIYAVTIRSKTIENASDQTLIAYHPTDNLAEMSLAYILTKEIGSVDLDGKAISGITSSNITATEYDVLKENNINVCLEKYGNAVIDGGNMAGGEKVDVVLSEFWIKLRMEEDLAQLKVNNPKIPYTDRGVALLVDATSTRLKLAVMQGIIATDVDDMPEYEVTYLPVAEVPQADRANRAYNYVKWSARLAGSIRTGRIEGVLTI